MLPLLRFATSANLTAAAGPPHGCHRWHLHSGLIGEVPSAGAFEYPAIIPEDLARQNGRNVRRLEERMSFLGENLGLLFFLLLY